MSARVQHPAPSFEATAVVDGFFEVSLAFPGVRGGGVGGFRIVPIISIISN